MTERLKNFIYDSSDILLALLIIVCMFLVISWKITDIMDIPIIFGATETSATDLSNIEEEIIEDPVVEELVIIAPEDSIIEDSSPVTSKESDIEVSNTTVSTIEIPKGTVGMGIANILKEHKLIDETSVFISRVEELGLAPKLRYGTFTIKPNSSIDDIIHILTGTN